MTSLLHGIRVVDLTSYVAAPAGTAILADLGADVIHVEPLEGDPFRSLTIYHGLEPAPGRHTTQEVNSGFELDNRNKRSIAVALGKPSGRDVVVELVRAADVFVTNMLPGRLAALSLDFDDLRAVNPRLVFASLSGYGTRNDERDRRAFDHTAFWARAGIMESISEGADEKPYMRAAIGDQTTGMALAGAVGLALFGRERTGQAQRVDLSLFRTGLWVLGQEVQRQLAYGATVPHGPRAAPVNPLANYYKAGDGKWLIIHMSFTEKFWPRLCQTIDRPDLIDDPRFATHAARAANGRELVAELDRAFSARPRDDWGARLEALGVVWSPIQTLDEVERDPLIAQEALVHETVHSATGKPFRLLASPFVFEGRPAELRSLAPRLGEHTDQVLGEIGFDAARIARLRGDGVVR